MLASLQRVGLNPDKEDWTRRVQDLWAVSGAGVRTVAYRDLDLESCARWMWDWLVGLEWDHEWWMKWRPVNVQVNMDQRIRELGDSAQAIERLKQEIKELADG